jgi:putative toxin-antitoxin system antitoxin component (TIGR02293 family)
MHNLVSTPSATTRRSVSTTSSPLLMLGLRSFQDVPTHGHQLIRQGLSSRIIEPVSQYLGLGKGVLAQYMDLDRGTATRLTAKGQDLPPHAAESLLRLVEIHDMAADVFATQADASAWLRTPHPLLDNEMPLDAIKTSYGAQLVKNLLMSTKYGGAA